MKTVLITGVGGFFGSHLCKRLLAQGVTVYGVDLLSEAHRQFECPNYHPITASFEQYDTLYTKIQESVDVFFHFAWEGGFRQDALRDYELQLKNAKFACDAYMQAVKIGAKRFVNSGTNNQIEIRQLLHTPDYTPRGTTIYATAKIAVELITRTLSEKYETEYLGAMIPMPYGEGNRSMQLVNILITSLLQGKSPALIEGNNLYDIVYVEDIIGGLVAIAESGKAGRSYYIGHRKLKTFRQLAEDIRDFINPSVQLRFGEYKDPLNMDYSMIDMDLLYKDTGYECKSDFRKTILQTTEWMKNNLL